MTSFGNISKDFKTSLIDFVKDKKLDNSELDKLKNIAKSNEEKQLVELLSKDNNLISNIKLNGSSETSINLNIDDSFSNDIDDIEIKKYSPTQKNNDDFKKVFPNSDFKKLLLDKGLSELLIANVFEKTLNDLKNLINDKSNGFTPETFFKTKEYLAKKVNDVKDLNSANELMNLLEKVKSFIPEINNDNRFTEIYSTLSLKKANYLHNKINNTNDLRELKNLYNSIKNDKTLGNNVNRLFSAIEDNSKSIFNKKIFNSKSISDLNSNRKILEDFKVLLSKDNYSKLEKELNSKSIRIIDSELKNLDDFSKSLELFTALKKLEKDINKDTYEILNINLQRKTIKLLDDKVKNIKTFNDYQESINIFNTFKKFIPEATSKLFESDLKAKSNIISLYGKNGIKGIDQSDVIQGDINDCFFLSALIGLAHFRPNDIPKMITSNHDGTYFTVKFPGAKESVTVSRPTKEEMSKYAKQSKNDDSIWAAVLEKAFAQYQNKGMFGRYWYDNHYDAIDNGGFQHTGINILTGGSTDTDVLSVTSNDTIRKKVQNNIKNNKIITLSSFWAGDESKNISPDHVYAILGYNKEKDTFIIRNPWGELGEPKGLKYNDNKKDGVFEVTMEELNKYFNLIAYEE